MKQLVRVFALFLALTFAFGMMPFSVSAEESSEEPGCKVLVWTDASGEHVIPYTDFTGWDKEMATDLSGTEYQLYDGGVGTYQAYYDAGFRGRYDPSETRGSYGLALVKIGDIVNPGTSYATANTYEMKINRSGDFKWAATATGGAAEYPVKGIIFYDPNITTDDPVNASIDTSKLGSSWYGNYPPACHVSGADGAALYEAVTSGMVVVKAELREHNYQGGHCTVCGAEGGELCRHPNGLDDAGICPDCGAMAAVAKVGDTHYADFTTALENWIDGTTLTLLADIPDGTVTETIQILNKTVTLDLNGHTLDMSSVNKVIQVGDMETIWEDENGDPLDEPIEIFIPGELTIRDSGTGGAVSGEHVSLSIYGGTVNLESGTLNNCMFNYGTFNMTGGKVIGYSNHDGSAVQAIDNDGTVNISGGELTGWYGIWNNGTVAIFGSPVITGQDLDERNGGAALANVSGTMTVSGSPVLTGGSRGEFLALEPITFNIQPAEGTWSVYMDASDITDNEGIFALPGEGMELDVSKFTSKVENYYVAKNDDGSLALVLCDHAGEIAVYNGDGTHDITCPCGKTVHEENASCSGGTDSCVSGAICQVCGGEYGSRLPHTFNPNTGNCASCDTLMAEAALTIGRLTTFYESAQEAANAGFGSRHTLELCQDVNLSGCLTIHDGCMLDLSGCTLSSDGNMALYVSGSARITDSGETGSIKVTGNPGWGIWVQGDLVMERDFPIVAPSQAFYYNSGLLDLTALSAPSSYNIYVANATSDVYSQILLPAGNIFYIDQTPVARDQALAAGTELTIAPCYTHADADTDHSCDFCLAEVGDHEAAEGSHNCGYCGEAVTDCADTDGDGKCDVCGELLGVIRVAGANRWATALLVADEMKAALGDEKFDAIIIASGNDFADALAGSYLATVKNAPILLSYGGDNEKYAYLDDDNINYVKENLAEGGVVYILGGEKAVPTLYEDGLEGYDVVRLGGANRFETNILILEEAGIADGSEVLVCTSANFADSLSASATGKPILLVWNDSGALYGSQPGFLEELKEKNCTFTILGGENAVSAKLADEVAKYGEVDRLAGNTRMETSVLVAEKYFDAPETAVLAYAWNYPDGLCGGSLAYALKAPLILTMPKYEAAAVEYAAENDITTGYVLGGDGLIGDAEVRAIFAMAAADQIVVKN